MGCSCNGQLVVWVFIVILLLSSLWFIWNNCICKILAHFMSTASNIIKLPITDGVLYYSPAGIRTCSGCGSTGWPPGRPPPPPSTGCRYRPSQAQACSRYPVGKIICTNFVNLVIFVKHNSVKFVKTTYIGCPVVTLRLAADADSHIVPAVLVVAVLAVVTTVTSVLLVLVPAHNHGHS